MGYPNSNHFLRRQQNRSMMPKTTIIACEPLQERELVKRRQFESGQGTYKTLVSIQFGGSEDQTHRIPNMATIPISKPQTIYTTLIMTT
jgi:hypothetical protein